MIGTLVASAMSIGMALLILAPVAITMYGLYVAFKENVILGIIGLLLHPLAFIIGVMALAGNKTLTHKLAKWLRLP